MAAELIGRFDARKMGVVGLEQEIGGYIRVLAAAGIEAIVQMPRDPTQAILMILSQAAGLEQAEVARRAGQFLDDVEAVTTLGREA